MKCEDSDATVVGESFSWNVDESVDAKIGESTVADGGGAGSAEGNRTDAEDKPVINGAKFSLFFLASQILLVPVAFSQLVVAEHESMYGYGLVCGRHCKSLDVSLNVGQRY